MIKEIAFHGGRFRRRNRAEPAGKAQRRHAGRWRLPCRRRARPAADRDEAVRVVLIKGAGGARLFPPAADLNSLAEYPSAWSFRNRVIYEFDHPQHQEAP